MTKSARAKTKKRGGPPKKLINLIHNGNILTPGLQKILWEQPHSSSGKHIPGKLRLYIGMPVMLRYNSTMCLLPNYGTISISREQVLVLPNFSMTDYGSQGWTRPDNPVALSSCKNHQAYYTCLSRSASAAGTIIIQGFDTKKITGGASGYLRQEFRELPNYIYKTQCNVIIQQFQKWKGIGYTSRKFHSAIHWNQSDPMSKVVLQQISSWKIIQNANAEKQVYKSLKSPKSNLVKFVVAQGSIPINVNSASI